MMVINVTECLFIIQPCTRSVVSSIWMYFILKCWYVWTQYTQDSFFSSIQSQEQVQVLNGWSILLLFSHTHTLLSRSQRLEWPRNQLQWYIVMQKTILSTLQTCFPISVGCGQGHHQVSSKSTCWQCMNLGTDINHPTRLSHRDWTYIHLNFNHINWR